MTRGPYTQFAWHMGQWLLRKTSSTANIHSKDNLSNLVKNNFNKHENKNNKSYNNNASVQSAQSPDREGAGGSTATANMTNTATTNSNQEYVTSSHEIYFEQGSDNHFYINFYDF